MREVGPQRGEPVRHVTEVRQRTGPVLAALVYYETGFKTRMPNAEIRKDHAWLDHVNLSISRINTEYFGHSTRWHADRDVWWCALAFDAALLADPGWSSRRLTNIYTSCRRAGGAAGLEALFADRVVRWTGNAITRGDGMPDQWTTCRQAEVLYPERLSCEYLRRVYVATGPHADIAASTCDILLRPRDVTPPPGRIPIEVRPDVFVP